MKKLQLSCSKKILASIALIAALAGLNGVTSPNANAAAAGLATFSVLGGLNFGLNNGGGTGWLAGGEVAFWLGPVASLTVGGEYLSRAFSGASSNINWIEVPVEIRFPLFPMLSLGVGGFYDFAVTSNAGSNYGAQGSLRLSPVGLPLFVEGRFNYGLNTTNFANGNNELQALVGFSF